MKPTPDCADNRETILDALETLVETFPPIPKAPLEDGSRQAYAAAHARGVAWGWLMRVMRSVKAATVLEDAGLEDVSAPLQRTVIEHVLRLEWATRVSPATLVELALKDRSYSLTKIQNAAAKGTPLPPQAPELIEAMQSEADPDMRGSYRDLTSLMLLIPEYTILYQQWLTLTQVCHPTLSSADAYFTVNSDFTLMTLNTRRSDSSGRYDAFLPSLVLLAVEAFVKIVGIEEVSEQLEEIRDRVVELGTMARVPSTPGE